MDHTDKTKPSKSPTGYRDITAFVKIDGHDTEIQINTPQMLAAKNRETPLYEERRSIEASALKANRTLSAQENARINELKEASRKIYAGATQEIEREASKKKSQMPLKN